MLNIGKLLFLALLAIGLGVFLGAVPLKDGMTAAEHGEAWFDPGVSSQEKISRSKRIESRTKSLSLAQVQATVAAALPLPEAAAQAPITAGAANTPEATSASDKAALDAIISRRASGR